MGAGVARGIPAMDTTATSRMAATSMIPLSQ